MGPLNRLGLRSEGATRRAVLFDTIGLVSVLEFLVEASCFTLLLEDVVPVTFVAVPFTTVSFATAVACTVVDASEAVFFLVFFEVASATGACSLIDLSAIGAARLFEAAGFFVSDLLFSVGNLVSTCTDCRAAGAVFDGRFFSLGLAAVGLTGAFLVVALVFAAVPVALVVFSLLGAGSGLAATFFTLTVVAVFLDFEAVALVCFFFAAIASLPAGSKSGAYHIRTCSRVQ